MGDDVTTGGPAGLAQLRLGPTMRRESGALLSDGKIRETNSGAPRLTPAAAHSVVGPASEASGRDAKRVVRRRIPISKRQGVV